MPRRRSPSWASLFWWFAAPRQDVGNSAVVAVEAEGTVVIDFVSSNVPPGSVLTGCGGSTRGCVGRLKMKFRFSPTASGHVLGSAFYLHGTNQIACLSATTPAVDLEAGVPIIVDAEFTDADDCNTPMKIVSLDAVVSGTVEVASRKVWKLEYRFEP